LKEREGTARKRIGYVNLLTGDDSRSQPEQACIHDSIAEWAIARNFTAAVWTALPPTFEKETGNPFSVQNAYEYLIGLPISARNVAIRYIANAPEEVMTPLRREILRRPIANAQEEP
jgi:hypothetical protein